jgi:hypothetical protein
MYRKALAASRHTVRRRRDTQYATDHFGAEAFLRAFQSSPWRLPQQYGLERVASALTRVPRSTRRRARSLTASRPECRGFCCWQTGPLTRHTGHALRTSISRDNPKPFGRSFDIDRCVGISVGAWPQRTQRKSAGVWRLSAARTYGPTVVATAISAAAAADESAEASGESNHKQIVRRRCDKRAAPAKSLLDREGAAARRGSSHSAGVPRVDDGRLQVPMQPPEIVRSNRRDRDAPVLPQRQRRLRWSASSLTMQSTSSAPPWNEYRARQMARSCSSLSHRPGAVPRCGVESLRIVLST